MDCLKKDSIQAAIKENVGLPIQILSRRMVNHRRVVTRIYK